MRKKNILDILTQEFIAENKVKRANFERCINDFELVKTKYIVPFLSQNQQKYGYIFNLSSSDKNIASKSQEILDNMAYYFKEIVSECPEYFLDNVKNMGFKSACDITCFNVLLFNATSDILLPDKKSADH